MVKHCQDRSESHTQHRHSPRPEGRDCVRSTTSRPGQGPGQSPASAPPQARSPQPRQSHQTGYTLKPAATFCTYCTRRRAGGREPGQLLRSKRRSAQRCGVAHPSLLPVRVGPRQGPGLTGRLPSGHRSSSGASCCSQDLRPAAGAIRAGPGARLPSKPALRLPEAQPGRDSP